MRNHERERTLRDVGEGNEGWEDEGWEEQSGEG